MKQNQILTIIAISVLMAGLLVFLWNSPLRSSDQTRINSGSNNHSESPKINETIPSPDSNGKLTLAVSDTALFYGTLKQDREKMEKIFQTYSGTLMEFTVSFEPIGANGKIGAYDEDFLKSLLNTPAQVVYIKNTRGLTISTHELELFSKFTQNKKRIFLEGNVSLVSEEWAQCKVIVNKNAHLLSQMSAVLENRNVTEICSEKPVLLFKK